MKILFIHGFASSGRYKMADQLRILIKGAEVLSPDVPPDPAHALAFLERMCREQEPDLVVGHSLGGFWAQKLRGLRKVLVNPDFHVSRFMESLEGEVQYLSPRADGAASFTLTRDMILGYKALEQSQFDVLTAEEKDLTLGFFASGDELVRQGPEFALHYGKPGISYPGGHQPTFPEMKNYIVPAILDWL